MNLQEAKDQARERLDDLGCPTYETLIGILDQIVTDSYQAGCRETAERIYEELLRSTRPANIVYTSNMYDDIISILGNRLKAIIAENTPEVGK